MDDFVHLRFMGCPPMPANECGAKGERHTEKKDEVTCPQCKFGNAFLRSVVSETKPQKKYPVEKIYLYHDCIKYIEKKYDVQTDIRSPREASLWLWICDNEGDQLWMDGCVLYLTTNSAAIWQDMPDKIKYFLKLLHDEFAENPEDEGINFWVRK